MVFSIVGYFENLDEEGADEELNPIPDPTVREEGKHIFVSNLNLLIGAVALLGTLGVRAYIDTPSLRRVNFYHISPLVLGIVPTEHTIICKNPNNPIALDINEGMKAIVEGNPAANETHSVFLLMSDAVLTPVTGEIFKVRATAAITEIAGEWKYGEITFENPLPQGTYQIVGARVLGGTNTLAFRFISLTDVPRPGGICASSLSSPDYPFFRNGGLGVWLEFDASRPPSLEVICRLAGGVTQELFLDLIKVA